MIQNLKTIFFIRHAKAESIKYNHSDFERKLHVTGIEEAYTISNRLFEKQFKIDAFISSSAWRTIETCEIFCKQFKVPNSNIIKRKDLYLASAEKILEVIHNIDSKQNQVALFAHNPGITDCIQSLELPIRIYEMPACGILGVSAETIHWSAFLTCKKKFIYYDAPL